MKQFIAFVKKEFLHVFRDSKTLLMLFGLPIAQIILFGFALSNEIKDAKVVIVDYAKDFSSTQIIEKIQANQHFIIAEHLASQQQIEAAFRASDIKLALVFQENFNSDLQRFKKAQVQLIADASDPNTASTLVNYVNGILRTYQLEMNQFNQVPYQIIPQTRMLYNPALKGATNFVPGVMALVLLLVCVLMTSVSIVREKERGNLEVLLVSPINPIVMIIAKAIPYFFLSLINLTVIILMSIFLLDMPMNGSLLLLYFESSLLILAALALGLLISNSAASQQAAMLVSLMGMLVPTIMLTGFMFPLENMPFILQVISNVLPSKWYYIIVKSVMIKGLGIAAIWKETLILAGMTVVLLVISFRKFKIRLA